MSRRHAALGAMFALLASHAASAAESASAAYPVRACRDAPGAVNRSWNPSVSPSGHVEALDTCGASGAHDGLVIRDRLGGPPDATSADAGWWTVTAPPGTSLTSLEYSRFLEAYSDAGWRPESRAGSATSPQTVLETCTFSGAQDRCSVGVAGGARNSIAVDATSLSIGGRCTPTATNTVCERGASVHSLRSILYGATVRLADTQDPTIDGGATTDLTGGWRNAESETVTVNAADNTGIRYRRVYVDGELEQVEEPTVVGGCQDPLGDAYTYLTPCAGTRGLNGARSTTLTDLPAWGEGTHTMRVGVVDTDGREVMSGPMTVRLDFDAPPAPVPAATGGSHWRSHAEGEVTWMVPSESDRAPVARVDVEVCAPSRPCSVTSTPGGASGATLAHPLPALSEGETRVRIRHTDQAGNASAWSSVTAVRHDATPPVLRALEFPALTVAVGAALSPAATFEDSLSGMREQEREMQVDDGDWRPQSDPVIAEAGRTYRLRLRGVDRAGNVGAWQTSEPVAVSPPAATPSPAPVPTASAAPTPPPAPPPSGVAARASAQLRLRSAVLDSSRRLLSVRGTTARGVTGSARVRIEIRRSGRSFSRTYAANIRRGRFGVQRRLARAEVRGRLTVSARYAGARAHRPATTKRRSVLVRP